MRITTCLKIYIKVAPLNNNAFCIVMGKITREDRIVIKALRVQKNCVLSVYYDKICLKFASHHFLLYVVYMCEKC